MAFSDQTKKQAKKGAKIGAGVGLATGTVSKSYLKKTVGLKQPGLRRQATIGGAMEGAAIGAGVGAWQHHRSSHKGIDTK